jgi:hypothetical protein
MEPHREEPRREEPKATESRPEEKRKRFRLIKLEERIAPGGGNTHGDKCGVSKDIYCFNSYSIE